MEALSRALDRLQDGEEGYISASRQIRSGMGSGSGTGSSGIPASPTHKYDGWLKIAVFHHPVTGRQQMNDEFMQLLAVHGFQICLHGHVHEAMESFHQHDDQRGINIIGAGTFGAPTTEQVTGIPLQYNLLTFDPATGKMTVNTRKREKPDGAWSADARWGDRNDPKPWYRFRAPGYRARS
uniref:Calcineurin-like phosphoesterase n=1 Tax=Candidatus Kentrum sp. DK TaxID=2126562 RepID=A0A450T4B2_9GAMM|nr:MAG: hypothetical protein BECKDK2373C_GA0170839_108914 [Candidatus Kentron sp. DK]